MVEEKKVVVIGGGISGLASACLVAKEGHQVILLEKNDSLGGRARKFEAKGFTFDMGPSWYWMPDVFERFFTLFGKKAADFYELIRLNPSYKIWFKGNEAWDIPADLNALKALFEKYEKGTSQNLDRFLEEASIKYHEGIGKFVFMPGHSLAEYLDTDLLKSAIKLDLFNNISRHIKKYFKDPRIIAMLEFPVLFLGAMPRHTPALYSLMNHADMQLGTWYPQKGMSEIIKAMENIAHSLGVKVMTGEEVRSFVYDENLVTRVVTKDLELPCDAVVASADYHHIDTKVLAPAYRMYSEEYWHGRKMAPSSLLYYIGVGQKIPNLHHHNLFFDTDFNKHASQIYIKPSWPDAPLFYVCVPSKTDDSVAPPGCENLFILIPTAPGLIENPNIKDMYFNMAMDRLEARTGTKFRDNIIFRKDFGPSDFVDQYNSFKGNAYGLANTLMQTGPLKPKLRHKKLRNLVFAGQLTVPGPGMPPSLISGELAANEINRYLSHSKV